MRGILVAAAVLAASSAQAWAAQPIAISGPAGQGTVTSDALLQMPSVQLDVAYDTEHGPRHALFEGPLLWTVLDRTHVLDPQKIRDNVRQIVTTAGIDNYTAILAIGEISPGFEAKQVLLADKMDGKPLDQPRLVVPGDKRGGRSVHDVVRITVEQPAHGS